MALWFPADLSAQSPSSAPAVVPRQEAYLDGPASGRPAVVRRWRTPTGEQPRRLAIFFEPPPEAAAASDSEFEARAAIFMEAVRRWTSLPGVPLTVHVTARAEEAAVRVKWVRRFDAGQAGMTRWGADADGWIQRATIILALRHSDDSPMSREFFRSVALHEAGHLLGLPHSEDPGDVMHPGNRNYVLSDRDRTTVRRLYRTQLGADPDAGEGLW